MPAEVDGLAGVSTKTARIAWWNTHLTPPKGPKLPQNERDLVLDVIVNLLSTTDILFVGEVSKEDLRWLSDILVQTPFDVLDATKNPSGRKFGLGVIYNVTRTEKIGHGFKIELIKDRNIKIYCRMDFIIDNDLFSFLISHWPSRLQYEEGAATRGHFGSALRKEFEIIRNNGIKYIVLLGDYNDEPFDLSMTAHLRGCRDPSFVTDHPELLYNPFWKHIACSKGYAKPPHTNDPTGTCFYGPDKLHRWRVFDQMLFCASFVGHSDWHINEKGTGVWRYAPLVEAVESSKFKLDHLPIFGELEKDMANG